MYGATFILKQIMNNFFPHSQICTEYRPVGISFAIDFLNSLFKTQLLYLILFSYC